MEQASPPQAARRASPASQPGQPAKHPASQRASHPATKAPARQPNQANGSGADSMESKEFKGTSWAYDKHTGPYGCRPVENEPEWTHGENKKTKLKQTSKQQKNRKLKNNTHTHTHTHKQTHKKERQHNIKEHIKRKQKTRGTQRTKHTLFNINKLQNMCLTKQNGNTHTTKHKDK